MSDKHVIRRTDVKEIFAPLHPEGGSFASYWDTASKYATKHLSAEYGNSIVHRHISIFTLPFIIQSICLAMLCGAFHNTAKTTLFHEHSCSPFYTPSTCFISKHKRNTPAHLRIYIWYFFWCSLSRLRSKRLKRTLAVTIFNSSAKHKKISHSETWNRKTYKNCYNY